MQICLVKLSASNSFNTTILWTSTDSEKRSMQVSSHLATMITGAQWTSASLTNIPQMATRLASLQISVTNHNSLTRLQMPSVRIQALRWTLGHDQGIQNASKRYKPSIVSLSSKMSGLELKSLWSTLTSYSLKDTTNGRKRRNNDRIQMNTNLEKTLTTETPSKWELTHRLPIQAPNF